MNPYRYAQLAQVVQDAQQRYKKASEKLRDRGDPDDPRTQAFEKALHDFGDALSRAYPGDLGRYDRPDQMSVGDILAFLEGDPVFFRSGYFKESLLENLKKRRLTTQQKRRVRDLILRQVRLCNRREFRRFCKLAPYVADAELRVGLDQLRLDPDHAVRRRAQWVLDALEANPHPERN
ncbi:hypothetical protein LCM19_03365 [Qipengyuania flava]|nr:hypothetical protein [Qipengyuania flava]